VSTKPAEAAAAPPKSKKMLVIVVILVVVIALGAVGAVLYLKKQREAAAFGDEAQPEAKQHVETGPPTYLPLDNMVVNLADQGGERVAQIGVTLVLQDAKAEGKVKLYLPTIRSSVLLLVSQRTAEELLKIEGKEKLAKDILREASVPFGGIEEVEAEADTAKNGKEPSSPKRRRAPVDQPIQSVLFSSFIVQ
jgi:flagellar FliL protein